MSVEADFFLMDSFTGHLIVIEGDDGDPVVVAAADPGQLSEVKRLLRLAQLGSMVLQAAEKETGAPTWGEYESPQTAIVQPNIIYVNETEAVVRRDLGVSIRRQLVDALTG